MHRLSIILATMCTAGSLSAQQLPPDSLAVELDGRVSILRTADLKALPHASLTLPGQDGTARQFTGIPLRAVLERAGLDTAQVHGDALARTLLIAAQDGYCVAFGLADLDSAITGRALFLAFAENGQPLDARRGPWQLLVPGDLHGRRSVRQVAAIRVLPPAP